jgi:RHS repeat-associated protein
VGDIPTGTSGTIYFDGFESRTGNFIGADPNGPQLPVPLTDLIFRDGFESADLTAWDSVNTGGGNLSVTSSAAAIGGYGLQATASGTTSMQVTDYSPLGEKQYHTRFYFNPSNFNLTPEDRVGIFSAYGGNTAFRLFLRYSGGTYWIQQDYQTDNLTYVGGVYRPLTAGWQALEFDWRAASAPGANDGSLSMSINGVLVETLSGIDNDTYTVETVQMGLVASVDAGMSGSLYFDGFVSQSAGPIGLDPNGPTLSDPIAPPDLAFSDDFESGDLSKWSGAVTNSGNLAVSTEAADQGLYGLKVNISGTSSMYARYYPAILEDEYHARFRFHPNSLNLANGKAHYLYEGSTSSTGARLIRLEILSENSEYKLRVQVRKDDGTYVNTGKYTISNDWHTIQVGWKSASTDGSNDGMAELWIDDVLMESLTGVDNDLILLNEIRLGAPSGLDTGTSGAMLFDDFTAYRSVSLMESSSMPEETSTPTPLPEGAGTETPTPTPLPGAEGTATPTPEPTSTETSGSLNFNVSELYKDGSVTPLTFNLQHAQTSPLAALFPAVFNPNMVNLPPLQEGTPTATGSPTNTPTLTASPEPTYTPTWTVTPQLTITETPIVEMFTDPTFTSTSFQPPVGPVTIFYVYDKLYRLEEANYSTGEYYHYTYDPVGNRLSEETNIGTKTYLYDDSNRLSSVDGVTYTWDDNGNLLSDGTNTYAYDSANRLTSVNGTTTYQYNGLGDRISQTVDSVTTNYTLDLNTGLTQVLNDGTTEYLYGNGRIAQVNTSAEYFLGDALGSVRQMADANGEITFARGYDPYGVVTYTTGASQTEFGFTGEQYDTYIKLIYLRSRLYSPYTGRFLTKDSWLGDYNKPLSLNHWAYVEGNPINRIDPSGQCYIDSGNMRRWKVWEYPIVGPCRDNSGPISPDEPHWHEYWSMNLVCSEWLACSREEVVDALSRFTFPGQNPLKPVQPDQQSFVAPFSWFPGIELNGMPVEYLGAIISFSFDGGLHVRNVSRPTHIFHKGQVDRQAKQVGRAWYVVTHGTGNNIYFAMDVVNQETGAGIFTSVDRMMRKYLEAMRILNWIKGLDC